MGGDRERKKAKEGEGRRKKVNGGERRRIKTNRNTITPTKATEAQVYSPSCPKKRK